MQTFMNKAKTFWKTGGPQFLWHKLRFQKIDHKGRKPINLTEKVVLTL